MRKCEMAYTRKGDRALILSPIRKVDEDLVALGDQKRLKFAFKLTGKGNTLRNHLDAVIEVFHAFQRERNSELIPDCITLKFEAYSGSLIDLSELYPQLDEFIDPFGKAKWHKPALLINTHIWSKREKLLSLELTWQDKTYEQYISKPAAFWRSEK